MVYTAGYATMRLAAAVVDELRISCVFYFTQARAALAKLA
jgi:hypothetical protein